MAEDLELLPTDEIRLVDVTHYGAKAGVFRDNKLIGYLTKKIVRDPTDPSVVDLDG
jgi:hypothetical protein